MDQQLSLFSPVIETKTASITKAVSETKTHKQQAIERYLKGEERDSIPCVNEYQSKGSKNYYFRLSYRLNGTVKHVHIPGGNIRAKLAQHRAKKLQSMIDRGADLAEILAAVEDYRNGKAIEI